MNKISDYNIAVLIPCLNEEAAIVDVVNSFQKNLPTSKIFVFDNNSDDSTVEQASKTSAEVFHVPQRGKGNVVRSMFRTIVADIYVLVDGDGTYLAEDITKLITPVVEGSVDMVVGDRLSSSVYDRQNKRRFHGFGNRLVRWLISKLYRTECKDILSGYRVFSRAFVDNFPVMSDGFEIETELTLHTLDKKIAFKEISVGYKERPLGGESKLNTFSDGIKILKTIVFLFKNYKPFLFFGTLAALISLVGIVLGAFPVIEYFQYQYIYRVPLAILAASMEIIALLFFCCGLILDTSVRQHRELMELRMLDYHKAQLRDDARFN